MLEERLAQIGGCGDGNCQVHIRSGQHTNGGCRCFRDHSGIKAQQVVYAYKQEVNRLILKLEELETENTALKAEGERLYQAGKNLLDSKHRAGQDAKK